MGGGFAQGFGHGCLMVGNAATFHQFSGLNNYVKTIVQQNGGAYSIANVSAHVGVYAGYAATGAWAWGQFGLPTYHVGIAPSQAGPFHVLFGTANGTGPITWYHAVGMPGNMWITGAGTAQAGAISGTFSGIPIIFPAAVGTAPYSYNCITAAGWGFVQGWWPF